MPPINRAEALRNADKLRREGSIERAIAAYVQLLETHPDDWSTANTLGDVYMGEGRTADALQRFHAAAEALTRDGLLDKAAAIYRKILKLSPGDETAATRVAAGKGSRKRGPQLPPLAAKAHLDIQPDVSASKLAAAVPGIQPVDSPAAAVVPRKTVTPTVPAGEVPAASSLKLEETRASIGPEPAREMPTLDDVFADLRDRAARTETSPGQQLHAGVTLQEAGMVDEAIAVFHQVALSRPHRLRAAFELGRLYGRQGATESAIGWLEQAAEAVPDALAPDHAVLYGLGDALAGAGKVELALTVFRALAQRASDYQDVGSRIERLSRAAAGE